MKIASATAPLSGLTANFATYDPRDVILRMDTNSSNPLVSGAPDIDFDVIITIDMTNPLQPLATIGVQHDGFPCYELALNGNLIYTYDSAGNGPTALFGSGDVTQVFNVALPQPELLP